MRIDFTAIVAKSLIMTDSQKHAIGLVFYPGMTSLDMIGPQQVFSALPDVRIHRLWKTLDPVKTDDGMRVLPDTAFENCHSPKQYSMLQN
jgi:cyclohexyl-isocyanide hydratase